MKKLFKRIVIACMGLSIITSSVGYSGVKANTIIAETTPATDTSTAQATYTKNSVGNTVTQAAYMEQVAALNNVTYMFNTITLNYACDIDYKKMRINMLKAMLSSLDPYSVYMEPQQATDFKQVVDNHTGGIGVVMEQKDKNFVIKQVVKDSPAEKAGIKERDIIESVDGYLTSKITDVQDLGVRVRGKIDTIVDRKSVV